MDIEGLSVRNGCGVGTLDEEVVNPRSRRSNFGGGRIVPSSCARRGNVLEACSRGLDGSFLNPPLACRGREKSWYSGVGLLSVDGTRLP